MLYFHPPGLFPVTRVLPCPRPLVGLTSLTLSVGSGGGGGTYLVVTGGFAVVAGCSGAAGLPAGIDGMDLVPAPWSTVGI